MSKKYYSIGEVAKIMDMSTKSLRIYDQLGLIKPTYTDPHTKYRYYNYDQFFMIDVIKYMNKVLFIPLQTIASILTSNMDITSLDKVLQAHKLDLQKQIEKQQYAIQLIDNLLEHRKSELDQKSITSLFDSYNMSRTLYYKPMDIPIHEVDMYTNRSDFRWIHPLNTENDTMCLLFSLSDYLEKGTLYVKGFGMFSDQKIENFPSLRFEEGRYLNKKFTYSEANCETMLQELLNYGAKQGIVFGDTSILMSKTISFHSMHKYEYQMMLQLHCIHFK